MGDRAFKSCDDDLVEWDRKCFTRNECGRLGERPCLLIERPNSCNEGLVESGLLDESDPLFGTGFLDEADRMCLDITPCGGVGQRACNLVEQAAGLRTSCDDGLVEVVGCNGTCLGASGVLSSGRCFDPNAAFEEPGTNAVVFPPNPDDPLRGYADLHLHLFANLAFGGGVIAGAPYSESGGAMAALYPDFGTNLDLVGFKGNPIPVVTCPSQIPDCGSVILHGDHGPLIEYVNDIAGTATGDHAKSNFGAPFFNGWPTWRSTSHQQAYYKWLERAWQSGLRLTVVVAVNSEVLCRASKHLRDADCGDPMKDIDTQLDAISDFQVWLDKQPGGGWFRVVHTPEEAEAVIREGKLAVVLAIETDNLFDCRVHNDCTNEYVAQRLDEYYNRGVRHMFMIHDFDNGFGGTAIWRDELNVGNVILENEYYNALDCEADVVDFELDRKANWLEGIYAALKALLTDKLDAPPYPHYMEGPHCNARGLSAPGKELVTKLMDRGMIFDIDHLSFRSIRDTAALVRERGGYPVVAGHATFTDLSKIRTEAMRNREQLDLIRETGGMVGMMTNTDNKGQLTIERPAGFPVGPITDDCLNSSKTLAQSYLYATQEIGVPVGFGSDFNGLAQHYSPRFGDDACTTTNEENKKIVGQRQGQLLAKRLSQEQPDVYVPDQPLAYPFTIDGFGRFDQQVTGQRTFDFNTDGFAHIGLYPDLIADLGNVGVTKPELEPLFHSAAAYIDLWKRARSMAAEATPEQCANWTALGLDNMVEEFCSQ
jgi:microsomal dipeptidase-like Zn-dependent dipeptidase